MRGKGVAVYLYRNAIQQLHFAGETSFITASDYPLAEPEHIIYSVCLQCNTGCGIKVKLLDSVAVKIDGNPLAPQTMFPHLPYNTPVDVLAKIDGALCPKGQAGLQTVYGPYRIRKVLKRAGKRGENKWITIPFEQAIDEIVMAVTCSSMCRARRTDMCLA